MNNKSWQQSSANAWNDRALEWHERSEAMWTTGSRKTIIPFIQSKLKQGSTVLDAGCGDGYGSYLLSQNDYKVIGIDIAEKMIKYAKGTYINDDIEFLQGDLSDLPLDNKSVDAIMAINSLEWTENPLTVLNEFHRVMKNKGSLFIGLLGPTAGPRANSFNRLYGENVICNTMMPWELERLALENGWNLIDHIPVYKEEAKKIETSKLSKILKQSLTFMWVFHFEREV